HVRIESRHPKCNFYVDHGMSIQEGSKVWIALRPEKVNISKTPPADGNSNTIKGLVHDIGYLGGTSTYRIQIEDNRIVEVTSPNQMRPKDANPPIDWDQEVYLSWEPSSSVVLTK
ncbi:MAG: TOBE domain-containing protein, partial [Gammaproteobacteria bacterium]|nr:TOBE domain-containing protein [Gammaproteobacteria bacterium]